MRLRADVGEVGEAIAEWWQEFSTADDLRRQDLMDQVRDEQHKRTRQRVPARPPQGDESPARRAVGARQSDPDADSGAGRGSDSDSHDDRDGDGGNDNAPAREGDAVGAPRKRRRRRKPRTGGGGEGGGSSVATE
jgi:poly(A) polymerase